MIVIKYKLLERKHHIATNKKSMSPELITADTPIPFSAVVKEFLKAKNIKEDETKVYKSETKGKPKPNKGKFMEN